MTRNAIRAVLATLALSVAAAPVLVGCKASASVGAGDPKPPPPPPPPPPPATTAAAVTPPPPADPPKAAIKPPSGGAVDGDKVTIPGAIVYETGKDVIKPESEPTLTALKTFLDQNPQVTMLRIEGHTDSDGDDAMNLKLSGARALAAVKWLTAKGISGDRLIAVGFGKTKPIADNSTKDGKAQNRRTEFHIAALDGKPYKNRAADGGGTVYKLVFSARASARFHSASSEGLLARAALRFSFGGSLEDVAFVRCSPFHRVPRRCVGLFRPDAGARKRRDAPSAVGFGVCAAAGTGRDDASAGRNGGHPSRGRAEQGQTAGERRGEGLAGHDPRPHRLRDGQGVDQARVRGCPRPAQAIPRRQPGRHRAPDRGAHRQRRRRRREPQALGKPRRRVREVARRKGSRPRSAHRGGLRGDEADRRQQHERRKRAEPADRVSHRFARRQGVQEPPA